jgi:hypothetical protein
LASTGTVHWPLSPIYAAAKGFGPAGESTVTIRSLRRYPAVMVTDTANFRYPCYHKPEDTIDEIDFERMARVVRGLGKVVEDLAGREQVA